MISAVYLIASSIYLLWKTISGRWSSQIIKSFTSTQEALRFGYLQLTNSITLLAGEPFFWQQVIPSLNFLIEFFINWVTCNRTHFFPEPESQAWVSSFNPSLTGLLAIEPIFGKKPSQAWVNSLNSSSLWLLAIKPIFWGQELQA